MTPLPEQNVSCMSTVWRRLFLFLGEGASLGGEIYDSIHPRVSGLRGLCLGPFEA